MAANRAFHVSFPVSDDLKGRVDNIVNVIRESEDARKHVGELTEVIIAMTEQGLQYLFVDSLVEAEVSPFHIKAVQLGVNSSRKALEMVGRQVLRSMTDRNLRGIVDYMEAILLEVEYQDL